jgi:adenylosuccinate synthase
MKADVVLGLQLGDEGKGKVTDYLLSTGKYTACVRFQGGANAGHTIIIGSKTYKLHMLPSSVMHPDIISILSNGVYLDLEALQKEALAIGISNLNLRISEKAHVVLPTYKIIDKIEDQSRMIGTTGSGIGPTATYKYDRTGIRIADFINGSAKEKIDVHFNRYPFLTTEYNETAANVFSRLNDIVTTNCSWFCDTTNEIRAALTKGRVLLEGAQGTDLDIDHGDYPYVTSSTTTIGAALSGTGLNHTDIGAVYGVVKPYVTYSGFKACLADELSHTTIGKEIAAIASEVGVTTGRPRRISIASLPAIQRAIDLNGVSFLIVNKMDIIERLSESNEFPIKTWSTELDTSVNYIPIDHRSDYRWSDVTEAPGHVQKIINTFNSGLTINVHMIGNGPDRQSLIKV